MHGKIDVPNDDAKYIKEALEGYASKKFLTKLDAVHFLMKKKVISPKQSKSGGSATFDKMLREVFYAGFIEYPADPPS